LREAALLFRDYLIPDDSRARRQVLRIRQLRISSRWLSCPEMYSLSSRCVRHREDNEYIPDREEGSVEFIGIPSDFNSCLTEQAPEDTSVAT
jgi:hypothetical protein